MLAGELKSLPKLDIVLLEEVKFMSEICYCLEVEVLIKVALADKLDAFITMSGYRMSSIVKNVVNPRKVT